jgi:hypothetical protein
MAISIDTVYQRVLAICNKEQRGYFTPQEFNLMANQAQLSIFESYFYELSQRSKVDAQTGGSTEQGSNISELLAKKLDPFTSIGTLTSSGKVFPTNYLTGKIFVDDQYGNRTECTEISTQELSKYLNSNRHRGYTHHFASMPVFVKSPNNNEDVMVYGGQSGALETTVYCEVITKPADVQWGYVVVNEQALYNVNTSVNFTLHDLEEDTLVYKILELAGIVINKEGLMGLGAQKDQAEITNQKL